VLFVAWIFQVLTVPVSAHMVGRAGYRTKHLHRELLTTDELEAVVQKAAGQKAASQKVADNRAADANANAADALQADDNAGGSASV
jgi:multicomponent Na+:H+ antiporter subunit G